MHSRIQYSRVGGEDYRNKQIEIPVIFPRATPGTAQHGGTRSPPRPKTDQTGPEMELNEALQLTLEFSWEKCSATST